MMKPQSPLNLLKTAQHPLLSPCIGNLTEQNLEMLDAFHEIFSDTFTTANTACSTEASAASPSEDEVYL